MTDQTNIASLLLHGEENALTTVELVKLAGLKGPRELRSQVERERMAGALILSTVRRKGGYYLPSMDPERGREEIGAFIRTVHARAVNSLRVLHGARRALRECPGQIDVDERGANGHA